MTHDDYKVARDIALEKGDEKGIKHATASLEALDMSWEDWEYVRYSLTHTSWEDWEYVRYSLTQIHPPYGAIYVDNINTWVCRIAYARKWGIYLNEWVDAVRYISARIDST